jgi:hypothetical protein
MVAVAVEVTVTVIVTVPVLVPVAIEVRVAVLVFVVVTVNPLESLEQLAMKSRLVAVPMAARIKQRRWFVISLPPVNEWFLDRLVPRAAGFHAGGGAMLRGAHECSSAARSS